MADFAKRVLELVSQPAYGPMPLKKMARSLGLDEADYREFRGVVRGLVRDGKLDLAKDKTLRAPRDRGHVVGTFRRTNKGFGFVRPLKSSDRSQDIHIPAEATRDASTGDEVAVRIVRKAPRHGGNAEGRIVRVVSRASGTFVGTYFEELGMGFVQIDGTTFRDPITVGDPGAKGAKPGDKVVIEMVRYPSPVAEGEGVITELIGTRGQPGVDTLSVIRALGIPDVFDEEALLEARERAGAFDENDVKGRLDLRDVLTITIDPALARDFDDAITLDHDDRGFWTLGVHIADVGHFVKAGSALDRVARKRGNSVYLPDRVIPMLPEVLSNGLASLQQDRTRYTMSVFLEFDEHGVRTNTNFARSVIRVDKRFSYEQAFEVMTRPTETHEGIAPVVAELLARMLDLARLLRRRRFQRGALELNMPEVEVELGDQGEVVGAHLAKDDESHQVIEEFMLAANEAVAEHLTARQVGFLRRGHADPEPHKLRQFAEFARALGLTIDQPQSRFELQRVLRETADSPEARAVHYGLLRSLKQATYTAEYEGHYALASDDYCHFTSPIRRYPDLQVHRQLTALLAAKKPKNDPEELVALAEHCTRTERRADIAEREVIKIKLLTHLESRIGEAFTAVIVGVEDFGLFCQLLELPIDGLLHVTSMADDYYYLEAETRTLVGRRGGSRHRLGDQINVRIGRVDVDRRELDLVRADDDHSALTPPAPARSRASPPPQPQRAATAAGSGRSGRRSPKLRKKKAKESRGKGKRKKRG